MMISRAGVVSKIMAIRLHFQVVTDTSPRLCLCLCTSLPFLCGQAGGILWQQIIGGSWIVMWSKGYTLDREQRDQYCSFNSFKEELPEIYVPSVNEEMMMMKMMTMKMMLCNKNEMGCRSIVVSIPPLVERLVHQSDTGSWSLHWPGHKTRMQTNPCGQGTDLSSLSIFNKSLPQHMLLLHPHVQKSARMDRCGVRWVLMSLLTHASAGAVREHQEGWWPTNCTTQPWIN